MFDMLDDDAWRLPREDKANLIPFQDRWPSKFCVLKIIMLFFSWLNLKDTKYITYIN